MAAEAGEGPAQDSGHGRHTERGADAKQEDVHQPGARRRQGCQDESRQRAAAGQSVQGTHEQRTPGERPGADM